jgi:hydroxylaminobenzene mutase
MAMASSKEIDRRLMWHGMLLFVLGLLVGLTEAHLKNSRMGLAAHLEGLMNGTFLIAVGAIWSRVQLSNRQTVVAYWTALYGTYVNLITTIFAAVVGANSLSPITGAGHSASAWQETMVTAGFVGVGVAILGSSTLILWGLRTTPIRNEQRRMW